LKCWFRNTTWNDSVQRAFDKKLRRAHKKDQYLRIQATTLARTHPDVALRLLDLYFALPEAVDRVQAHVDRATALLALGRVDEAIASYEAALAREARFPNPLTDAYVALPYLIATRGIRERYGQALQLLKAHESRLAFPVDRFRWHAVRALVAADSSRPEIATKHAVRALAEVADGHSPFRGHPSLGLVTKDHDPVISKLRPYAT
jgi:tetratricopeptide (TPR) repeat protein